jgi:predicted RNA-binding protein with RPS1 domain
MNINREYMKSTMDFDWSMYEDGWNGRSLLINRKVKTGDKHIKVYSHNAYAADMLAQYTGNGAPVPTSKELRKNVIVNITDFAYVGDNTVLASINGGSNNVIIDLNKEGRYFNTLQGPNGSLMTKQDFVACLRNPEVKKQIIDLGLVAKVGTDVEKASIWDGYVEVLSNEMREQIRKKNKAYMAKILSSNNGGFVVEVANTVKAFMPGSMSAANKLNDYESLVGKEMEVMVESYDEKFGFVVSRKKYIQTIIPIYTKKLASRIEKNKDLVIEGTVTGTTPFGIFVELDDHLLTGMLHKTLVSDELRDKLRNNEIQPDTKINVYVHKIEKGRIILSDVPSTERDAVIAKREAEDAQEKLTYVNAKKEAAAKAREAQDDNESDSEETKVDA